MKKTISKILMILVGALFIFTSCEDTVFEEENTNDYSGSGDNYAVFADQVDYISFTKLNADNEPADYSDALAVKLYGPAPSSDLNVTVEVVEEQSTALAGYHFTFDETVTIPAGELSGKLNYTLLNGYPYNEDDVPMDGIGLPLGAELKIVFEITDDGDVPAYYTGKRFTLTVVEEDFCPFEPTDFEGTYENVTEIGADGSEYPTTYEIYYETAPADQANPDQPKFMIAGLWYSAPGVIWGETTVDTNHVEATLDISDPTSPSIIIPGQFSTSSTDGSAIYPYYVKTDQNGQIWPVNYSTYNSCEQQLELYYLVVYGGPNGSLLDYVVATVDVSKKTIEFKHMAPPPNAFNTINGAENKIVERK